MSYKLDEIFELVSVDGDKVVIKVNADNPLKVAMFPFVSGDYAYITVTRGKNHILTVVKNDGKTFDFYWGYSGHTLISDGLEELKRQVCNFIDECHIILECNSYNPQSARIYYNPNYKKWQLTLENCGHYFSNTAKSRNEMIAECEKHFVRAEKWAYRKAVTGIDVWDAVNPEYIYD